MGCRTGFLWFWLVIMKFKDVVELVTRMFIFMKDFEGDVSLHVLRTAATILT